MTLRSFFFLSLLLLTNISFAQGLNSFKLLNEQRIATNKTGMEVLGAWGAANIVTGIVGYSAAKDQEWRSFHQMNAIWGAINLGIATAGYFGAQKEAGMDYSYGDALHHYESIKRLFLLNAGLDGLYIASGFYLTEHAKRATNSPEVWRGYGKSVILQGAGLLIFDAVMFSAHGSKDKAWYKLLKGVSVSGNGIGLNYKL